MDNTTTKRHLGGDSILRQATFSVDQRYRYRLTHAWGRDTDAEHKQRVCFVMLNPSTADESHDDHTLRRCRDFAQRFGYEVLDVVNMFAYRATRPVDLWTAYQQHGDQHITGPLNDDYVRDAAEGAHLIIVGWGNHGDHYEARKYDLLTTLCHWDLYCLKINESSGAPAHPLMLPRDSNPVLWAKKFR